MVNWRRRLYDNYVSSKQGGQTASTGYRSESPFINNIIKKHVPLDFNIRIMDLGCGAGGMIYWLKKAGYSNISGIDSSPEMVAAANNTGVVEVRLGDIAAELKSIENKSIDVIFIMDVLEHMERDTLFQICDDIFRVLRPGGRIIAHVPNAEGIFGSRIRYGDLTHELSFTASSIRQLFQTIGFDEIKCYEDTPIPHGLKSSVRAVLWQLGTIGFRVLHLAETGTFNAILSQNLLATAVVPN